MHMADALLSPVVGMSMNAVSIAAIGLSVAKVNKDEIGENKIPIMGVAGALVFAGQMVNFTIPLTGSSGHIGGGILLAGLLGGIPAFLSIAAVIIIQCLFFADGGLLALGSNIFTMGVIPCLIAYPLIFKPLLKNNFDKKRLSAASIISVLAALEAGAFVVVLLTLFSGITALPFGTFLALMLPIHLAIGLVEGIVTAAILSFIHSMRPEIIDSAKSGERLSGAPIKRVLITLAILTFVTGAVISLYASVNPDGLEWSIMKTTGQSLNVDADNDIDNSVGNSVDNDADNSVDNSADNSVDNDVDVEGGLEAESAIHSSTADIQKKTAFLPDYAFEGAPDDSAGTTVSGLVGAVITFAVAGAAGFVITKVKKVKKVQKMQNIEQKSEIK